MPKDTAEPADLSTPIHLIRHPGGEWEAILETAAGRFAYRDPSLAQAYMRAQKWAPGPTRPFFSSQVDAIVGQLDAAITTFDGLVNSLVAAGCTENEIRVLVDGPYLEDLALRAVLGMARAEGNGRASPDG